MTKIALLQLAKQAFFDEMYADLVKSIKSKVYVREIETAEQAISLFNDGGDRPIIFATDEALTLPEFRKQRDEAILFVRGGGTLIVGAHFPSFAQRPDITDLFACLSLPWQSSSYTKDDFEPNPSAKAINQTGLVSQLYLKALYMSSVKRADAVYVMKEYGDEAENQGYRRPPRPPPSDTDFVRTPVAYAKAGLGRVGYIGFVNAEQETNIVVMAMLGLN